jgi:hypothetical protein
VSRSAITTGFRVPDLDAAIGWAEKCPGAQWGVIEVRPAATAFVDGAWTR